MSCGFLFIPLQAPVDIDVPQLTAYAVWSDTIGYPDI